MEGQASHPTPLIDRFWMVCQYSTRALVSSGKRKKALDPGAAEGGGDASHIAPGTIIVGRPVRCPHPSR
jgi:hypothetical protein